MSNPCKHNANFGSQGKDPICDYCGEAVDVRVMSIGDYEIIGRLKAKLKKAEAALDEIDKGTGTTSWTDQLIAREALKEIRK